VAHPILEKLSRERESLLSTIEGLEGDSLDRRVGHGWTVREVLTHLANAEEDHCKVIALTVRGDAARLPAEFSLDHHNAQRLSERGYLSLEQILSALSDQRQRTRELFERLNEEQLEMPVRHPALGETTVSKIFRVIGLHERMHLKEIVRALEDGELSQKPVSDQ
jgi:uncharacterized damage-inducible protein DinB